MDQKRQYNAEMEAILLHLSQTGSLELSPSEGKTVSKGGHGTLNGPLHPPRRQSGRDGRFLEGGPEDSPPPPGRVSPHGRQPAMGTAAKGEFNGTPPGSGPLAAGVVKPALLLHSCCGPCSTAVLERLLPYFQITVFYYNPNILPKEEYDKRLGEQRRLLHELGGIALMEGRYDPQRFLSAVRGLEGEPEGGRRCERCFALRMEETARVCREGGYDLFTTTLTVSPHKNAQMVNQACETAAAAYHVAALPADFKKRGGYPRSIELSRQHALYRQSFCGCPFSNPIQQAFHSPLSEGV